MFSKQFNTTIHVSINRRMNKYGLVYSHNRMIFINKKQKTIPTHAQLGMILKNIMLSERKLIQKSFLSVLLHFYDIQVNAHQIYSEQKRQNRVVFDK